MPQLARNYCLCYCKHCEALFLQSRMLKINVLCETVSKEPMPSHASSKWVRDYVEYQCSNTNTKIEAEADVLFFVSLCMCILGGEWGIPPLWSHSMMSTLYMILRSAVSNYTVTRSYTKIPTCSSPIPSPKKRTHVYSGVNVSYEIPNNRANRILCN